MNPVFTHDPKNAWIQTAGGGIFHILEPQQDEIRITDIAHALSMMCRFTGHVRRFYSVAEHSYYASLLVPPQDALWALLHDSPEAYIADLNRPLKHCTPVGATYMEIEERIMDVIAVKFGLPLEAPASVKEADRALLYAERDQLLPPYPWDKKWSENEEPAKMHISGWLPEQAREIFLQRFNYLSTKQGATNGDSR